MQRATRQAGVKRRKAYTNLLIEQTVFYTCLLYTSDAADEVSPV